LHEQGEKFSKEKIKIVSGIVTSRPLRHLDALNDLENSGSADDEDEKREEPRTHRIFFLLTSVEGLGNRAPRQDVLGVFLVGDAHSLFGCHFLLYQIVVDRGVD